MIALSAGEIAAATGGTLHGVAADEIVGGPVVVDSRTTIPGSLFVAVRGEHLDGHDFGAAAIAAGAVAVLAERPLPDVPTIVVNNGAIGSADVDQPTVVALAALAHAVSVRLTQAHLIAVTGSSGKTSTKDLMASMFASAGPTVAPRGSNNNEIGFPLTVLTAHEGTQYVVLEMGARKRGHIAYLCSIALSLIHI